MNSQLEGAVQALAEQVALEHGVELYWLEMKTPGPRWQVITRRHYELAVGKPIEVRLWDAAAVMEGWLRGPIPFAAVRSAQVIESRFL